MSGGAFEYSQYRIGDIADEIQSRLDRMGEKKPMEELRYYDREYLEKYPDEAFWPNESEEVKQIFRDGISILKRAQVYAQRIDWFLSGDDGEDSLISRLKTELDELDAEQDA